MHDDHLSVAIKDAGETFEPPWLDVRAVTKRGRRRWWLTRTVAAATSLALVGGAVALVARVDARDARPAPAAAASLRQWEPVAESPLSGRIETAAAWTGEQLIVVTGTAWDTGLALTDAASYDPLANTWTRIQSSPEAMYGQSTVWTGNEVVLWGGEDDAPGHQPRRGFAFDPSSGDWRELPKAPYWSLIGHTAVWTGNEMLVWGGVARSGRVRGAAYDPAADEWRRIPNGPLSSRHGHEAVWAGDRMIVWGGRPQGPGEALEGEGAAYDPSTRSWTKLPPSPLDPVKAPVSFWTGRELVVAGGFGAETVSRAGAAYDPVDGTWREIADVPLAAARGDLPIPLLDLHTTPVWTGESAVFVTADGVLSYDPDADRWSKHAAPRDAWRMGATVAWTGDELLVWSGRTWDDQTYLTTGWSGRD